MFPGKNENREKSHRTRYLLVWWGVLCLLLIPLTALLILNLPWTQKKMIDGFLKRVENIAAVTIKIGSYEWSPLSSQMHVASIGVKSDQKDFLRCDAAELDYQLSWKWPYFIPTVLFLDKPVLYLEKDSLGRWHIPREITPNGKSVEGIGSSAPAKKGFFWKDFPWPEVRVKSGRIIAFQQGQIVLSLQNITGTIPYQVTDGKNGPILKIKLDQWSSGVSLR